MGVAWIPFPLLSDLPGIQVSIKSEGSAFPIETLLRLLRKVGEPKKISIAMFSGEGIFRAMAIIMAEDEGEVGELEERLKNALSEVEGMNFKIKRLKRYGDRYVVKDPPKLILLGEPLVLIRKSRYLGYLRRICDLLDEGVYAFMRSIGEEDGEMIAKIHEDPLKKLVDNEDLFGTVEYVIHGMSVLENIPDCEILGKKGEAIIKIAWRVQVDGRMRKALVYYLYGLLKGIFKELGARVTEEFSEEEISKILVSKGRSLLRVRVYSDRAFIN